MSTRQCCYCHLSGYQNIVAHERLCGDNPDNLPYITVRHKCGHRGEHKPFDSTVAGIMGRTKLERGRDCVSCSIAAYQRAQAARTPEQIAEHNLELRAAFGPGEKVVDVLTGEEIQL